MNWKKFQSNIWRITQDHHCHRSAPPRLSVIYFRKAIKNEAPIFGHVLKMLSRQFFVIKIKILLGWMKTWVFFLLFCLVEPLNFPNTDVSQAQWQLNTREKRPQNVIKLNNSRFGLLTIPPMEKWLQNSDEWNANHMRFCLLLSLFVVLSRQKKTFIVRSIERRWSWWFVTTTKRAGEAKDYEHTHAHTHTIHFLCSYLKYLIRFDFAIDIPNACHICVMRLNGNSNIFISFHFDLNWISSDATPVQWTLLVRMHSPLLF